MSMDANERPTLKQIEVTMTSMISKRQSLHTELERRLSDLRQRPHSGGKTWETTKDEILGRLHLRP